MEILRVNQFGNHDETSQYSSLGSRCSPLFFIKVTLGDKDATAKLAIEVSRGAPLQFWITDKALTLPYLTQSSW